jgi:hypothetical protein
MSSYFHFDHSTIQFKPSHASYSVIQSSISNFTIIQPIRPAISISIIQLFNLILLMPVIQSLSHSVQYFQLYYHSANMPSNFHFDHSTIQSNPSYASYSVIQANTSPFTVIQPFIRNFPIVLKPQSSPAPGVDGWQGWLYLWVTSSERCHPFVRRKWGGVGGSLAAFSRVSASGRCCLRDL